MDIIKILIEGYAYQGDNSKDFFASPTTTLIYHKDKKILVDPGTNSKALLEALKLEGLSTNDIDILYLTHYHPDHFLNIRLFPNLPIHDGSIIWDEDKEIMFSDRIPQTNIEIIMTPGHSPEHSSLLVKTEIGVVCVAQDVFWWVNGNQKSNILAKLVWR